MQLKHNKCLAVHLFWVQASDVCASICDDDGHDHKLTILPQKYDLGVPIRDMRLLDVSLVASETGKMLVRDNAIVFSMEHVRLLITAEQVFVPRDGFENNNLNVKFVERLEMEVAEVCCNCETVLRKL